MKVEIEFDSITLPHKRIHKTYNIPEYQTNLTSAIKTFFNASESGCLIFPINVTVDINGVKQQITVFMSTLHEGSETKKINPRQVYLGDYEVKSCAGVIETKGRLERFWLWFKHREWV